MSNRPLEDKLAEALEKMIKLYDKIGCRVCDNPDGAIFPCENCPEMYECCQVLAEYKATATPQTSAQKQH